MTLNTNILCCSLLQKIIYPILGSQLMFWINLRERVIEVKLLLHKFLWFGDPSSSCKLCWGKMDCFFANRNKKSFLKTSESRFALSSSPTAIWASRFAPAPLQARPRWRPRPRSLKPLPRRGPLSCGSSRCACRARREDIWSERWTMLALTR